VIISQPPVVAQDDIPDEVTNRFHAVEDEDQEQVVDQIGMSENAHQEWNSVGDKHVDFQTPPDKQV
jgi:hypothetical protein